MKTRMHEQNKTMDSPDSAPPPTTAICLFSSMDNEKGEKASEKSKRASETPEQKELRVPD